MFELYITGAFQYEDNLPGIDIPIIKIRPPIFRMESPCKLLVRKLYVEIGSVFLDKCSPIKRIFLCCLFTVSDLVADGYRAKTNVDYILANIYIYMF